VKKTVNTTVYYHYDQAGQLIAENDINGNTIREYVYLDGIPLAIIEAGNIYFIHTDHLGTPQIITDEDQQVVWQADYDPFGEVNITTEFITNNLRFPGQYYDEETGLHYNYFRYYDPSIGRYITSDPIGLDGGLNTYNYVRGNPLGFIDLYGLKEYLMITLSAVRGAASFFAGAIGHVILVDLCTLKIDIFSYHAYGLGLGVGGAVSLEVGLVDLSNPMDIVGRGLAITGFIAAPTKGIAGNIVGSGPVPKGFDSYIGSGYGGAIGTGWGVSGIATRTKHSVSNAKFSDLPPKAIEIISKLEPDCKESCL